MAKLRIKNNEFGYLGNPSVKRDGVISDFTLEEVKEYKNAWKILHTLQESILKSFL